MRFLVVNCSVKYSGRLETSLAPAIRALAFRADKSISVLSDSGYKPLNWMTAPIEFETPDFDDLPVDWVFKSKTETLTITILEVLHDSQHSLSLVEPGLERSGTELDLQAHLADHPELISGTAVFVAREYRTRFGPVDILLEEPDGELLAVEVKRHANSLNFPTQAQRYVDAIRQDREEDGEEPRDVRGIIVAWSFGKRVLALADKLGIECIEIPLSVLCGEESSTTEEC